MENYFNQLVDNTDCIDKEQNVLESLKFNKNILEFNRILNTWRFSKISFKIHRGFDYLSKDELIASFRKIQLEISNREYKKFNEDIKKLYNFDYDEESKILTISI